jgi:hypothetical protein
MLRATCAVLVVAALAAAAAPLAAQQEPTPQREHTVRRGDTLWDLARAYLNNPFLWPVIYEANRGSIRNPHWIYPAELIIIPGLYGGVQRPGTDMWAAGAQPERSRFAQRDILEEPTVLEPAGSSRALVRAAEYRTAPWLADTMGLRVLGRLAAMMDPAESGTRLPATLRPFDKVYLNGGASAGLVPGDSVLVARFGRAIGVAGQIVHPLGVLRIDSMHAGRAAATLTRQFGDARIGDALLALDVVPAMPTSLQEHAGGALHGVLLDFVERHALYGAAEHAFVGLGRSHGLSIGDELSVHAAARPGEDPTNGPGIATVRVIRVEDGSATVRVTGLTSTALAPGLPVRLVRRAS